MTNLELPPSSVVTEMYHDRAIRSTTISRVVETSGGRFYVLNGSALYYGIDGRCVQYPKSNCIVEGDRTASDIRDLDAIDPRSNMSPRVAASLFGRVNSTESILRVGYFAGCEVGMAFDDFRLEGRSEEWRRAAETLKRWHVQESEEGPPL